MSSFFEKKKTTKEQTRETKRELQRSTRDLDREVRTLERQEQQIISEIRKYAKQKDEKSAKVLAGQLVKIRKSKTNLIGMKSTVTSAGFQVTTMQSNIQVAETMGKVAKTMGKINQQVDTKDTMKVMQEFAKQTEYMNIKEEMMDDALLDAFDDDEDVEEVDEVVDSVLAEIGLTLGNKMTEAPSNSILGVKEQEKVQDVQDPNAFSMDDFEKKLAALGT